MGSRRLLVYLSCISYRSFVSIQFQATGGAGLDTVKRALIFSSKHTGLATTDLCV